MIASMFIAKGDSANQSADDAIIAPLENMYILYTSSGAVMQFVRLPFACQLMYINSTILNIAYTHKHTYDTLR